MKKIIESPRFWLLFGAGVNLGIITYIQTGNWLLGVSGALTFWFGGAATVGTIDRTADKKVEAAKVNKK